MATHIPIAIDNRLIAFAKINESMCYNLGIFVKIVTLTHLIIVDVV